MEQLAINNLPTEQPDIYAINSPQRRSVYTPEQKAEWDQVLNGPGYYQLKGSAAYTYLIDQVRNIVGDDNDPKTVLVIGDVRRCWYFFERMAEEEIIDGPVFHQPLFFRFEDRTTADNAELVSKSLTSEMDAEQFRNFIATSVEKEYYPIAAVVIFDEGNTDGKPYPYLYRILEVPQWKNGHLVKTIRPTVFNVYERTEDEAYFYKESSEAASIDWRKDVKTFFELSEEKPVMLIEQLIPEKALTIMAAPSYTGKTHIALEMGLAMATGTNFLNHFKGPAQPVPISYHVPELNQSLLRSFMDRLGAGERLAECPDNFQIRTLEHNLWRLDSPQMIDSSRGRYVFLDTVGYFNDADDSASYTQAIEFAKRINNLIREGCLGVCALYHPPKYSKSKKETGNVMTLENQILGSAGYGGVLRSCLGMRNLHEDSNKGLWVYVQGLKNPGLEGPFQIEGVPLKLVSRPGESRYLAELLGKASNKKDQIKAMLTDGKKRSEIVKELGVSPNTVTACNRELKFDPEDGE